MTMRRITSHVLVLGWALASTALLLAPPIGAVAQDVDTGDVAEEEEVEEEEVEEENPFRDFERPRRGRGGLARLLRPLHEGRPSLSRCPRGSIGPGLPDGHAGGAGHRCGWFIWRYGRWAPLRWI